MARDVNVCTIALGAALLVLALAVPVFAEQPCRSFRIDADHQLDELFQDGNLVGGKGPVQVHIGEETFHAVLTLLRLGPKEDIPGSLVLDFFTLDAGHLGTLEASLNGVVTISATLGTFDGTGRVESGTHRFKEDAGVFHITLHHDFVVKVPPPISVHVNGKLCDVR